MKRHIICIYIFVFIALLGSHALSSDIKHLSCTDRESLRIIQNSLMPAVKEGHAVALVMLRQTMHALGQDMALESTPEVFKNPVLNEDEREWVALIQQKAADKDPFFQVVSAILHIERIGVPGNINKALQLLHSSANQGFGPAQYALGKVSQSSGDTRKAAALFREAGKWGVPGAWYNLGCLFDAGLLGPKDIDMAMKYWKIAAEMGHAWAQFNLGLTHVTGNSPQSKETGKKWLKKAAMQGHYRAATYLSDKLGVYDIVHDIAASVQTTPAPADATEALQHLRSAGTSYEVNKGNSLEFLREIQMAKSLFPEVIVNDAFGKAEINKYKMNKAGYKIDGIRFRIVPRQQKYEFAFVYAVPPDVSVSWLVSPMHMAGRFYWPEGGPSGSFENQPWPRDFRVVFKHLFPQDIQPDQEYILCFLFNDAAPVEIYAGLTCYIRNEAEQARREADNFTIKYTSFAEFDEVSFGLRHELTPEYLFRKAIEADDKDFINYAVKQGAEINSIPALWLCLNKIKPRIEIVKKLLALGADPDMKGPQGSAPLHEAVVKMGNYAPYRDTVDFEMAQIARVLLEHGASPNIRDQNGMTPLMLACDTDGSPIVIKCLLDFGADLSMTANNGKKAVDFARENAKAWNIRALNDYKK